MDLLALPLPVMALGRQSSFELTQESHHTWCILTPGVLHMTHFQWGGSFVKMLQVRVGD